MTWFDGASGRAARARQPILAFIGANGSGKSLLAVDSALASLEAGRVVLSTARLVQPDGPDCEDDACTWPMHPHHRAAHPLWRPLTCWQDLLDAEHCDVLLDEITGVASSRDSSRLPSAVSDMLMQLRRRDVMLRWTAPSWARADLLLREVTQAAVICRGLIRRRAAGQDWPASTWIWSRMLDARDLDEMTQSVKAGSNRAAIQPMVLHRGLQRVAATPGRLAYHTLEAVSSLGHMSPGGSCLICGGRLTVPACKGHETGAASAAEPQAAPARHLHTVGQTT